MNALQTKHSWLLFYFEVCTNEKLGGKWFRMNFNSIKTYTYGLGALNRGFSNIWEGGTAFIASPPVALCKQLWMNTSGRLHVIYAYFSAYECYEQ